MSDRNLKGFIVTKSKSVRFQVGARELLEGLVAIVPHACTEDHLPGLYAVKFEVVEGQLVLVATDRRSMGTYRLDATGDVHDAGFEALISRDDMADLLYLLKSTSKRWKMLPNDGVQVTLEANTDGHVHVTTFDRTWSYRARQVDAAFPAWKSLIPSWPPLNGLESPDLHSISKEQLAKLLKFPVPKHEPIRIGSPGGNKPLLVTIGDRYVAIVMPIRSETNVADVLPPWMLRDGGKTLTVVGAEPETAKAA